MKRPMVIVHRRHNIKKDWSHILNLLCCITKSMVQSIQDVILEQDPKITRCDTSSQVMDVSIDAYYI